MEYDNRLNYLIFILYIVYDNDNNFVDKSSNDMSVKLPLKLVATGKALPLNKVTSDELDLILNKPQGYVKKRSGILYRHHADLNLRQSELAAQALLQACKQANLNLSDLDLLLHVNGVAEQALPCTAANIFAVLNWQHARGYDLNASCVGFIPALQHAAALLNTGCYQRIAITACDLASRGLNWQDEESSLIFGDGAAAVILERGNGESYLRAFNMQNYPEAIDLCQIPAGGTQCNPKTGMVETDFYFKMHGPALFRKSAEILPSFLEKLLSPLTVDKIDLWLVHQASHLGMTHMIKRLGISPEKLINIYPEHGNQVAASLPTVLHEAYTTHRWQAGQTVVMLGTAAGLAVAGLIWQL